MAIYVIADLHLSLSVNKPMDVFGGKWHRYTERLQENWQSTVTPEDWVIIPGDISWGMNFREIKKDFEFLNSLNGRKIIIKGNHDYWWATMKKMSEFITENGFHTINFLHNNSYIIEDKIICGTRGWLMTGVDEPDPLGGSQDNPDDVDLVMARERQRLLVSIQDGRKRTKNGEELLAFIHYPPIYGNSICEPILEVLVEQQVKKCYYGHIHTVSEKKLAQSYGGVEFELIAGDHLGFTPKKI